VGGLSTTGFIGLIGFSGSPVLSIVSPVRTNLDVWPRRTDEAGDPLNSVIIGAMSSSAPIFRLSLAPAKRLKTLGDLIPFEHIRKCCTDEPEPNN
jgi:hypothetical protein